MLVRGRSSPIRSQEIEMQLFLLYMRSRNPCIWAKQNCCISNFAGGLPSNPQAETSTVKAVGAEAQGAGEESDGEVDMIELPVGEEVLAARSTPNREITAITVRSTLIRELTPLVSPPPARLQSEGPSQDPQVSKQALKRCKKKERSSKGEMWIAGGPP